MAGKIGDTVEFLLNGKPQTGFITQATRELGDVPAWRIGFGDRDIAYVPKSDVLRVVEEWVPAAPPVEELVPAIPPPSRPDVPGPELTGGRAAGFVPTEDEAADLERAIRQLNPTRDELTEIAEARAARVARAPGGQLMNAEPFTMGEAGVPPETVPSAVSVAAGRAAPLRTALEPPTAGEELLGQLGQTIETRRINRAEGNRWIEESLSPAFVAKYGEAPIMSFQPETAAGGPWVEIHTGGWGPRAEELGLQAIGQKGFATAYRIPEAISPALKAGEMPTPATAVTGPGAGALPPVAPPGGATTPPAVPPGVPPVGPPPSGLNPRVPPERDPVIKKALQVLKGVKRVSKTEQAALFSAERKARFARGMGASENLPVREGLGKFFGAHAGEFPRADIQPIVGQFSQSEVSHLFSRIEAPGVLRPGYDRYSAAAALEDLLHPSTAKIPMPKDLALLERAFGPAFARTLYNKKRTASQAVWDEFIAAWNLPRSLLATLDLSGSLRQGSMLAPGNISDWRRSVGAELKAFGSEAYAKKAWDDIYLHPNYERLTNAGLDLTQRGAVAPLLKREESFMSRWASLIPGVKASERAYVTMLNKLRFDVSNKMLTQLEAKGLTETELGNELKGVADFVNWTTGRGPALPNEGIQAILNGLMFSPRFTTSRFAVLKLPVTAYQNPAIRGKLAKDLVEWVAVTGMVAGLAKGAGARVEIDPRSGEWGKITIGHTRYDPWAGMQPVGRLIAQMYWGQGKSSLGKLYSTDDQDLISKRQRLKAEGKGKISAEEFAKSGRFMPARLKVLQRFLRSKLQPLAGETWDQVTGEDWLGGEAELGQAFSKDPRINLFVQNLAPILAQDILDAVVSGEHPLAIAGAASASAIGIGASTYQSAADIGREQFPGASLERLRAMPKDVQKKWAEEADRRRGFAEKLPPRPAPVLPTPTPTPTPPVRPRPARPGPGPVLPSPTPRPPVRPRPARPVQQPIRP